MNRKFNFFQKFENGTRPYLLLFQIFHDFSNFVYVLLSREKMPVLLDPRPTASFENYNYNIISHTVHIIRSTHFYVFYFYITTPLKYFLFKKLHSFFEIIHRGWGVQLSKAMSFCQKSVLLFCSLSVN